MNPIRIEDVEAIFKHRDEAIAIYYAALGDVREQHSIEADRVMPASSLMKVPVLIEALRQVEQRKLTLGQRVTIEADCIVPGSRVNEFEGKASFSLLELLRWSIIASDDTATNQIIRLVTPDAVNALCQELGLTHTLLEHGMRDYSARLKGKENTTTAGDMGRLLHIMHRDSLPDDSEGRLSTFVCRQTLALMRECRDDLALLRHIPWTVNAAHKTGHYHALETLKVINHDMGIFYATGGTFILVVMIEGAEDRETGDRLIGRIGRNVYDQVLYTP